MKLFLKFTGIGLGLQLVLITLLGLVGSISPTADSIFELFLRIYEPMILIVANLGRFRGESAIIEPVWMGIAAGVLLYSILVGLAALVVKRGR